MVDCLAPAVVVVAAAAAAAAAVAAAAAADEARDATPRDATSRSTTTWTMRGLIGQWQQWLIVCLLSSWLDDRKGFFSGAMGSAARVAQLLLLGGYFNSHVLLLNMALRH